MADSKVSEAARSTRRRAYGRSLNTRAKGLHTIYDAINSSPDRKFLDEKEEKALERALNNLDKVAAYVAKLAGRLDV